MRRLAFAIVSTLFSLAPVASADDVPDGYSAPHVVPYDGGRIPQYAHFEDRPNWSLIRAGVLVASIPYGLSVLYALGTCGAQMDCRAGSQWLYLPVVGPFVTAVQAPTTGGEALSVFDGALQLVGAVLTIAGIATPQKVVVWQDPAGLALKVTPGAGPGVAGASLALGF